MKKILAFSSSNSKNSINHALVKYVAENIMEQKVEIIRLTDYELPLFSVDLEEEMDDYPVKLHMLKNVIGAHDALIISVNEHNRGPSAFFKNTIDWLSRLDINFLKDKKIMLMSTSPGANGAMASLEYTKGLVSRFGGELVEGFSFPSFNDNFDMETNKITNDVLFMGLAEVVGNFERQLGE